MPASPTGRAAFLWPGNVASFLLQSMGVSTSYTVLTRRRVKRMTEAGTLSIVRRANTYQVRYASNNPYDCDRPPQQCSDEGTLVAFLHQCGMNGWYVTQALADLRKGELVVLPIVFSHEQMQACFPSSPETREGTLFGRTVARR